MTNGARGSVSHGHVLKRAGIPANCIMIDLKEKLVFGEGDRCRKQKPCGGRFRQLKNVFHVMGARNGNVREIVRGGGNRMTRAGADADVPACIIPRTRPVVFVAAKPLSSDQRQEQKEQGA